MLSSEMTETGKSLFCSLVESVILDKHTMGEWGTEIGKQIKYGLGVLAGRGS